MLSSLLRGALGFSGFAVLAIFDRFLGQKTPVFRFWGSSQFADFLFFGIWFSIFVMETSGFSVFVSDVVVSFPYFVLLGSGFSSI